MALEGIISEIRQKSREDVERVRKEGKLEAEKILEDARAIMRQTEKDEMAALEKQIANMAKREISSEKMKCRKKLMVKRSSLVEKAYGKARMRIGEISGKEKEKALRHLVSGALEKFDGEYFYCKEGDEKVVAGVSPGLKHAGNAGIIGGVIIEDSRRERIENLSFDVILSEVREETIQEVSGIIFGGGKKA